MNTTRSHLDALLERRNLSGGNRMASLNQSIESMARKLNSIGADSQKAGAAGADRIEELERRMKMLAAEIENRQQSQGQPQKGSSRIISEIVERQNRLNRENAANTGFQQNMPPRQESEKPMDSGSLSAGLADIGDRIEKLRQEVSEELNGLQTTVANCRNPSSSDELERIAEGIRELQQAPRFNPSAFDALHNELDELRSNLGSSIGQQDFNAGISDINSRLDQISSGLSEKSALTLADIKDHFDSYTSNPTENADVLAEKIGALDETVAKLSESMALEALDQRLQTLVEAVDRIAQVSTSTPSLEPNLEAIESRLDEITRAIVAVSVKERDAQEPAVLERLEQRLVELSQNLDMIAQKDDEQQFNQLTGRIENLAAQLDSLDRNLQAAGSGASANENTLASIEEQLQELASRFDMQTAEKQHEETALGHLSNRIEGLSDKFGALQFMQDTDESGSITPLNVVADTSQIEQQLLELASSIDAAVNDKSADQQINNLEMQISSIAEKLNTGIPASLDLSGVENRLGVIEQFISTSQEANVGVAAKAAEAAVEIMETRDLSGDLIGALSEDLKALQAVALQSDSQTMETIDSVKVTLNKVADRLGSIEQQLQGSTHGVSETHSGARHEPAASAAPDMAASSLVMETESPVLEKISRAPSIDPSGDLGNSKPQTTEDNRPLEPGSGAPDISALVKRASEKFRQNESGSRPDSAKTDFVAAARRAAQSAVAEVQAVKDGHPVQSEKPEAAKQSAKDSLLSKMQNVPRRPIIIAAAAILMAVMAFAASKYFIGGSADPAAMAEAPVIEGSMNAPSGEGQAPVANLVEQSSNVRQAQPNNAGSEAVIAPAPESNTPGFVVNSIPKQADKFVRPAESNVSEAPTTALAPETVTEGGNKTTSAPQKPVGKEITSAPIPAAKLGPVSLRQAAAQGNPLAQYEIGLRYSDGRGIKRDMAKAATWFERAAAQEFAPAQYRLGSLYEKGLGVKRDLVNASNWYLRAAEQGNARAMHNLAVINAMGSSGKPDMDKAVKWFTTAANYGVKDSQYNLGILYGQGMGVKANLAESYKWFALAAKTGDHDSAKKRDEVANAMDPKALEKARAAVAMWKPGKLDDKANRVVVPEEWRGASSATSASLGHKKTVKITQMLLNKLGYKVGIPDGVAGPKTRRAILRFQKSAGLPQTGQINAETVKALQGLST